MALLRKPIALLAASRWMSYGAVRATEQVAIRWGEALGFELIAGFPKSGNTWTARMLGTYLGLPVPTQINLPVTFACVLHHHWDYHPALDRGLYVVRDGRDVMVSVYMNITKNYMANRRRLEGYGSLSLIERGVTSYADRARVVGRRLEKVFGAGFDPTDARRNLPRFIEAELEEPLIVAVRQPWAEHVRRWRTQARNVLTVRYEDLLAGGAAALRAGVAHLTGKPVDEPLLALAVDRWRFERQTGRPSGREDRTSFARKGIAGDWRNHFSADARAVFHRHAGDLLLELGYEADHSWVKESA
jgi:hypothetical protein